MSFGIRRPGRRPLRLSSSTKPNLIVSGSDLTNAAWSKNNLGAVSATSITDGGNASPVTHFTSETVAGLQMGRPATVQFTTLPATTRYVAMDFDATAAAVLDTQTGTATLASGWTSYSYVNGVFTGVRQMTTNSGIEFYTANGPAWANVTYQGNSGSPITAAFTNVRVTQ